MNFFHIAATQAVISIMERTIQNVHDEDLRIYVQQRIGYFEERCCGMNANKSGGLEPSEIAELYDILNRYHSASERLLGSSNMIPGSVAYLAAVGQLSDQLGRMIDG